MTEAANAWPCTFSKITMLLTNIAGKPAATPPQNGPATREAIKTLDTTVPAKSTRNTKLLAGIVFFFGLTSSICVNTIETVAIAMI